MEQADGPRTYSYDAAGRVTGADNPSPMSDEVFAYDELGNRTSQGEVVDAANRLQSRTGYTYAWDREGRLTARTNTQSGETTRFSWSDDGRLRSVTLPSGGSVRYAYDPLGRRISTTSAGGVRRVQTYGLDPNAVAEQSGGDPQTRYTFGLGYDTPLAMTTASSSAVFFQQDALSSVTSLTNAAGAVTGRATYDTYGQITTQTGPASPYTYTGREHEPATGLYHYRARWYDPAVGRFTSEDPVPATNLYGYVSGGPTALVDPTGAFGLAEQAKTVSIQGALAGSFSVVGRIVRCGSRSSLSGYASTFGRNALAGAFFGSIAKGGGKLLAALLKAHPTMTSLVPVGIMFTAVLAIPAQALGDWGNPFTNDNEASPYAWYVQGLVAMLGAFASDKYELAVDVAGAAIGQGVATAADHHGTDEECG